jgi:adenosylmethionine-8-amino-7-oxononanoate aminotransferase
VGGAIAVSPPLVIDAEEIDLIAQGFNSGLDALGVRR